MATELKYNEKTFPVIVIGVQFPNQVWATDFKGWFQTQDGTRVDPLTISDFSSRFFIRCQGLVEWDWAKVKTQFDMAFREYGLPLIIRSDNGSPFATVGLGGLSRLSIWFIRLGIIPERTRPGHPEDNGRHERIHRTLKSDAISPPKRTVRAQQLAFDEFLREYNEELPHESLRGQTPSQHYNPSPRPRRLVDNLFHLARINRMALDQCRYHFVVIIFFGEALC